MTRLTNPPEFASPPARKIGGSHVPRGNARRTPRHHPANDPRVTPIIRPDASGASVQPVHRERSHASPGRGYEGNSKQESRRNILLQEMKARAVEKEVRPGRRMHETPPSGEAGLREFLENAAVGMHWLAPDGTILWANRTELALLGYRQHEYVGHDFRDFVEDPEDAEEMLSRLRQGESLEGYEMRLRAKDGKPHWVRIDATPWSEDRDRRYARCFVLDIGDKKLADEARLKLAAIVESSEDAIVSKDLKGIITSWNAAAERILGYTAEEIVGKSILTLIPPELRQDEVEILRKIQAGERIEHFETVRVTKSGERIDVSLTISPVRDPQGRIIGAAKILRDVTMQKRLEAALRTTERLASVGRLAATVAHEINNPLEAVTNLIYLVRQSEGLPEAARQRLTTADEELQRVTHIARQTLGFYRDTAMPVWVSVPEAVEEMLAIYQRRLGYKQIRLRRGIDPGLRVRALQGAFKQIFSNLVSNAIDASPQSGAIEVRAWEATHPITGAPGIQLVVADSGCGVPEAIRRQIFAPFFTTKKDAGTGLGLWIVKGMLARAGGFIRCRSRVAEAGGEGSGTVMMVFLPSEQDAVERLAS